MNLNRNTLLACVCLAVAAYVAFQAMSSKPPANPDCPDGKCPRIPSPAPAPLPPAPPPKPKPRPWGPHMAPVGASVGGPQNSDGTEIACDLPGDFHLKNKGGRDGAGLCVFTSINHSAVWQDVKALIGFRDWMTQYPGGGYPEKVDQMIAKISQERNLPKPDYIQVEGGDTEVLKAACRNGLMPGVTYSFSPTGRYGGQRISHMVSLVHADDKHFVVLDNNYPGPDKYEWLTPEEFKRTYAPGWCVILLKPAPPPPPRNKR